MRHAPDTIADQRSRMSACLAHIKVFITYVVHIRFPPLNRHSNYMEKHVSNTEFKGSPKVGCGGHVVERRAFGRRDQGLKPPAAILKLGQYRPPHFARVFWKTLKVVGPFYLVSMPGEIKDPTQGVNMLSVGVSTSKPTDSSFRGRSCFPVRCVRGA